MIPGCEGRYSSRKSVRAKMDHPISLENPGEKSAEKLVYYKYLPEMDWIIACGVYLMNSMRQ